MTATNIVAKATTRATIAGSSHHGDATPGTDAVSAGGFGCICPGMRWLSRMLSIAGVFVVAVSFFFTTVVTAEGVNNDAMLTVTMTMPTIIATLFKAGKTFLFWYSSAAFLCSLLAFLNASSAPFKSRF